MPPNMNPHEQPPFAGLLGGTITHVSPERVTAELPVRAELGNRNGVLHGGAVMAFAVSAVGIRRRFPVGVSEGHDRDLGFHDKECQKALSLHPQAGGQDEAHFGQRRRTHSHRR